MAERISLKQLAEMEDFAEVDDMVCHYGNESVVPAVCSEGCKVEPDGRCPHGFPSLFLAMGLI